MRKNIVICFVITSLIGLPIVSYAHLTGAFSSYLAVLYDDKTISGLESEMKDTVEEIEALTLQVDKLEADFKGQQAKSIDQLLAYADIGLDTWYTLLQDNEDVVDVLGDQWIMEKSIDYYLKKLNELYLFYEELKIEKETLKGHHALLEAIHTSLERRDEYMEETSGLPLETIANYLDIDWTAEVEDPIIAAMEKDKERLNKHLLDWLIEDGDTYLLIEEKLNKNSDARYYFRSDHIYVEYKVNNEHVILIGQILQDTKGTKSSLVFETAYYNGFYLPEELLEEIPSFEIPYETLQQLDEINHPYIKQNNGFLSIKTK